MQRNVIDVAYVGLVVRKFYCDTSHRFRSFLILLVHLLGGLTVEGGQPDLQLGFLNS